jgi:hypothetical protein
MMKTLSIRVDEKELLAWRRATEEASAELGVKLSLAQWIRGKLNSLLKLG